MSYRDEILSDYKTEMVSSDCARSYSFDLKGYTMFVVSYSKMVLCYVTSSLRDLR